MEILFERHVGGFPLILPLNYIAWGLTTSQDSVDYVVHLGDYIYEYKNGDYGWGQSIGRIPLPDKEIYSLYDYRKRIATYRTDLDLLASHQQFPWIPVWDDHGESQLLRRCLRYHPERTKQILIYLDRGCR